MILLSLLLGFVFGAAEFFLTKTISGKATTGEIPVGLLLVKLASYAAVLLPVFFFAPHDFAVRFGIGTGAGVLIAGLICFVYLTIREKR